jgi:hypothetical protein
MEKIDTKEREFRFPNRERISIFEAVIWLPAFYPTVGMKIGDTRKLYSFLFISNDRWNG